MTQAVERIDPPSREVFLREYVLKQRPVIIKNLFQGQPIARISNVAQAREALGNIPMDVDPGYEQLIIKVFKSLLRGGEEFDLGNHRQQTTVREYLDYIDRTPGTRLICSELHEPPQVRELYTLPSYCTDDSGAPDDLYNHIWIGAAGNHNFLHFDADHRQVLQYQFFGRKHFILAPPSAAPKLLPIRNNATISPEGLPPGERARFIEYIDGYEGVVEAGEALFMPALIWHSFEYDETTLALSFRFRRNPYSRFLADNCHASYYLQELGWRLINDERPDPEARAAFAAIEEAFHKPYPSQQAKGEAMHQLFQALYGKLTGLGGRASYSRAFFDVITDAVRAYEFEAAGLYGEESSEPGPGPASPDASRG